MTSAPRPRPSFWAQNIANEGSDHFVLCGEELASDDDKRAATLTAQIGRVTEIGARLSEEDLTLVVLDDEFVLEVTPREKDAAGRPAAFSCHGMVPDEPDSKWADEVMNSVEMFASRLGRSLRDGLLPDGAALLQRAKKKRAAAWSLWAIVLAALFTLALLLLIGRLCGVWQ